MLDVESHRYSGFTLVELLIVIVVLAILTVVVVVAYNGIQQQTRNTQTISAARDYAKALLLYGQDNQSYPNLGITCLGQYDIAEKCHPSADMSKSTQLMSALLPYMNNRTSQPATQLVGGNRGLIYNYDGSAYYVMMILENVSSCPVISGLKYLSQSTLSGGLACRGSLPPL